MQNTDRVFNLITESEEVTWQTLLHDLVRKEGMDPWDVNVGIITQRYIEMIKELKQHDFRLSGKVLLAAALLLKIKANRLVGEDISELDRLLHETDEDLSDQIIFDDDDSDLMRQREELQDVSLIPRTPQPRKRKVSIFDLMKALEKALEVKQRRQHNHTPAPVPQAPVKTRDITEVIKDVYGKIRSMFVKEQLKEVTFSQLLPSKERGDKIQTFIPLLHLSHQRKIEMEQPELFGEISIYLAGQRAEAEVAEETQ